MKCPQCGSNELMKEEKRKVRTCQTVEVYQCLNIDCWHKFEEKKTEDLLLFTRKKVFALNY